MLAGLIGLIADHNDIVHVNHFVDISETLKFSRLKKTNLDSTDLFVDVVLATLN